MAYLEYMVAEGESKKLLLEASEVSYLVDRGPEPTIEKAATSAALGGFYHVRRTGFVVLSQTPHVLLVNQCKVTLFKILREGDGLEIGETYKFIFHELNREILNTKSAVVVQKQRCLVDRQMFKASEAVVYCPACGMAHHESCWQRQKGRCANGKVCQYQAPWDEPEVETA